MSKKIFSSIALLLTLTTLIGCQLFNRIYIIKDGAWQLAK